MLFIVSIFKQFNMKNKLSKNLNTPTEQQKKQQANSLDCTNFKIQLSFDVFCMCIYVLNIITKEKHCILDITNITTIQYHMNITFTFSGRIL